MKQQREKAPQDASSQSRVSHAPSTWRRWMTIQLIILAVGSGTTITVTLGNVGQVQVQVPPARGRNG